MVPLVDVITNELNFNVALGPEPESELFVEAEPFDESWLGREIDSDCINDLVTLKASHRINTAGEGGEIESFVINAPLFTRKIVISKSKKHYSNFSGKLEIREALLK